MIDSAALHHAERDAADHVDDDDDDSGDRVTLDELRRAVHRTVEVGLGGDLRAALPRLDVGDQPCVEVGVDRHLLTGHGVEGEPRTHLGHALGTLGDDDELDDDEDEEDDGADDERAADGHVAECLDDVSGESVAEHEPGRGNVEAEPEQRGHEQQRREHREVERLLDEDRGEQDDEREAGC